MYKYLESFNQFDVKNGSLRVRLPAGPTTLPMSLEKKRQERSRTQLGGFPNPGFSFEAPGVAPEALPEVAR
jgi:hypothetical protein